MSSRRKFEYLKLSFSVLTYVKLRGFDIIIETRSILDDQNLLNQYTTSSHMRLTFNYLDWKPCKTHLKNGNIFFETRFILDDSKVLLHQFISEVVFNHLNWIPYINSISTKSELKFVTILPRFDYFMNRSVVLYLNVSSNLSSRTVI